MLKNELENILNRFCSVEEKLDEIMDLIDKEDDIKKEKEKKRNDFLHKSYANEIEKLKHQIILQQIEQKVYSDFFEVNKLKSEHNKLQEENSLKIQIELCMKENDKNDISISDMKCELNKPTLA